VEGIVVNVVICSSSQFSIQDRAQNGQCSPFSSLACQLELLSVASSQYRIAALKRSSPVKSLGPCEETQDCHHQRGGICCLLNLWRGCVDGFEGVGLSIESEEAPFTFPSNS
jgi:hypothetical protein